MENEVKDVTPEEVKQKEFILKITESQMEISNTGIRMTDVMTAIGIFVVQTMVTACKGSPVPLNEAVEAGIDIAIENISNGISAGLYNEFGEDFVPKKN